MTISSAINGDRVRSGVNDMTLTWYLAKPHRVETEVGPVYRLNKNYSLVTAWVHTKTGPKDSNVQLDIRVEDALGVKTSIFTSGAYLTLGPPQKGAKDTRFAAIVLEEGNWVSMDIVSLDGTVGDMTIGLELE